MGGGESEISVKWYLDPGISVKDPYAPAPNLRPQKGADLDTPYSWRHGGIGHPLWSEKVPVALKQAV